MWAPRAGTPHTPGDEHQKHGRRSMLAKGQRDWSPLDTLLGTWHWEPGWRFLKETSMETNQLQCILRGRGKNEAPTHAPLIQKPHKMRFTMNQTPLMTYPFYRPRVSPESHKRWGMLGTQTQARHKTWSQDAHK